MDIRKAYEILDLNPDATPADLKLAYRDMVSVWHPDRFLHNPRLKEKAEQQLQEINEAFGMISESLASHTEDDGKAEDPAAPNPHFKHRQGADGGALKSGTRLPAVPVWLTRFLARAVDGIVFACILHYIEAFRLFPRSVAGWLIYVMTASLLWAFMEANLLSGIGYTPGKWLLGVKVLTPQGNKPPLLPAFKRSIAVWWYGLGAGFVPVMPIAMSVSRRQLIQHGTVRWDRQGPFVIISGSLGLLRTISAVAFLAMGIWIVVSY